jgi:S-adenosylmethionine/arginine decarboxylase-like enzyme
MRTAKMCPLNEGAIEEHHDANDNVTPTGSPSIIGTKSLRRSSKGHSSTTTISPSFLFAFLFVGVPLSYYAGRLFQPQVLQLLLPSRTMLPSATGGQSGAITTVEEKESPVLSTRRGALLEAAIYRRTRMKKGGSPVEECAQEEITVEEIFFPEEEAFGQYRMLLTEDDEEDEEEEEDDDEENDEKENDDDQVDTRVDTRVVHVIMDIERVNSEFLKDADRIREAIFETVWEASAEEQDISILSVHCQKMTTGGIFCAVILKGGNHMTVMTDPVGKLCSVDLSVMGEGHLLKVVPMLEEHFGVVGDSSIEKPLMRFRQLFRGPRYFAGRWETMDNDITELLLEYKSDFFFKKEVSYYSQMLQCHVMAHLDS